MDESEKIFIFPKRKSVVFWSILMLFTFSFVWIAYSIGKIILSFAPDFNVLWLASKDLLVGNNPYRNPEAFTGVGYPTNTLLFYIPLAILKYNIAQGFFLLISLGALVYSVFLSFKILAKKIPLQYFLLALALVFLSFPTKFTLGMGQNNLIAFLILLFSYFLYKKNKLIQAGILLGVAVSFKTLFGFFLLYFLLKKSWKLITYATISVGIFVIIATLISNFGWYDFYLAKVIPPLFDLSGREIYYNQGIVGFISRIFNDISLRKNISIFLSALLVIPTGYLTVTKKNNDLAFSLFVITLLLIDTLSWQHHFVWLIFPFVVVSVTLAGVRNIKLWILLGISYLLVGWNFKNPVLYSHFPQVLLLSNQFYGAVLLWGLNAYLLLKNKIFS